MDPLNQLAISTLATVLEATGVAFAGVLVAVAVLAGGSRIRAVAMAAALVVAPLLLAVDIWNTPQGRFARERPLLAAGGFVVMVVVVGLLAWLFYKKSSWLPIFAVVTLPFRLPIETDGQTANLLLPLYLVIAAGAIAQVVRMWRSDELEHSRPPITLDWAVLGFAALYCLQAVYSSDISKAVEQISFFVVPFALLYALLRDAEWSLQLAKRCLYALVTLAVIFVAIGFYEYATRRLLFNPRVIDANQLASYFRVNSLFFDPNIYGRFLALVITLLAAAMLWARRSSQVLLCALGVVVLLSGLVLTFSQSSFADLLVGLAVLGALRWGWKRALAVVGALVVLGAVVLVAAPSVTKVQLGSAKSIDKALSGRVELLEGGIELFTSQPVVGYGSGAFQFEYRDQNKGPETQATSVSHTMPVTVAAEQGVIGLLAYLALLIIALITLLRGSSNSVQRAAVAAAFAGLLAHTLGYAAFLEDPLTWTLLAAGAALAAQARDRSPRELEPEPPVSTQRQL